MLDLMTLAGLPAINVFSSKNSSHTTELEAITPVSVNIVATIYCYQAADFACSTTSSDGLLI